MPSILILLFLSLCLNGCSLLTTTDYDYYPLPNVYLEPCRIPEKPTTIRELHESEYVLRVCAKNSNADKLSIKKKIEGGVW